MIKAAGDRLTLSVAAFGLVISLLTLSLSGLHAGLSAAAGSVLALLNLLVLRIVVSKVIEGDIHTKLPRCFGLV